LFSEAPRNSFYHYGLTIRIFWRTFSICYKIHRKVSFTTVERRSTSNYQVIEQIEDIASIFLLNKIKP
jgi:hypothetical protein